MLKKQITTALIHITLIPLVLSGSNTAMAVNLSELETALGLQAGDSTAVKNADEAMTQLVTMAKGQSYELKKSGYAEKQAAANTREARSEFLPTLNGIGSTTFQSTEPKSVQDLDEKQMRYGLELRHNIFHGGLDQGRVNSLKLAEDRSRVVTAETSQTLTYQVQSLAVRAILAQGLQKLADQSVQITSEIAQMTDRRKAAGISGKVDILEAQSSVKVQKSLALERELERKQRLIDLMAALQLQNSTTIEPLLAKIPSGLLSDAWQPKTILNPENAPELMAVKKAKLDAQIADLAVSQSRAARFSPSLDVFADLTRGRQEPIGIDPAAGAEPTWQNNYQVGVSVTIPIWDMGRDGRLSSAIQQREIQTIAVDQAQQNARVTVENLNTRWQHLQSSLPLLKETYQAAFSSYQAQLALYHAGTSDIVRVLNSANAAVSSLERWYRSACELRITAIEIEAVAAGVTL